MYTRLCVCACFLVSKPRDRQIVAKIQMLFSISERVVYFFSFFQEKESENEVEIERFAKKNRADRIGCIL